MYYEDEKSAFHPRRVAASYPQHIAAIMTDSGETLTYGELDAGANRAANLFRNLGLKTGDTIAVCLPNSLSVFVLYWGAQRAGLYYCPIATHLGPDEVAYILNDSEARILFTDGKVAAGKYMNNAWSQQIPNLHKTFFDAAPVNHATSLKAALKAQPAMPIDDEASGIHLMYSSGTTGRPKGIRLPLIGGNPLDVFFLAPKLQALYDLDPNSIYLSPGPLYHAAPLVYSICMQWLGARVVVMDKFDPATTLRAIDMHRVSITQMVPTMFSRLLALPAQEREKSDVSSLTHVVHAAAPCPVPVKRAMIEWLGPIIYEYYAGSEGAGSTFITSDEWLKKPGSVGKADFGVLHICNEAGDELPAGEEGIVYFEGGLDFQYLNHAEKTCESRNPKHPTWATLGDIGYVDSDDYLFLTDRKSFMIISGGVNIYPQEIENLLACHPDVEDVAVIGVPDDDMGEAVKAVVQPRDSRMAGDEFAVDLIAYCRERLSHVKCPRSIDFDERLPREENGKLYKKALRERYWRKKAH